jgi:hypothetical protein
MSNEETTYTDPGWVGFIGGDSSSNSSSSSSLDAMPVGEGRTNCWVVLLRVRLGWVGGSVLSYCLEYDLHVHTGQAASKHTRLLWEPKKERRALFLTPYLAMDEWMDGIIGTHGLACLGWLQNGRPREGKGGTYRTANGAARLLFFLCVVFFPS